MKLTIQILTILLLFTQCAKEEVIKPKERIGIYGAGVGVTAPTIITYPDFELHVDRYSNYITTGIVPPTSSAFLKVVTNNVNEEFPLSLFLNKPDAAQDNNHIKELEINNTLFRITFETFNWDADKSTDEVLVVEKGRFLVEKVE